MVDLVAVVHRPVGLEVHHHRLGADREAAREDVEVLDRRLEVHQPLAGGVVDGMQLVVSRIRVTPTHWPPSKGFM